MENISPQVVESVMTPRAIPSLEKGKIPPQSLELEEAVLGGMLIDKRGVDEVIDILSEEVFYAPAHQKIYAAIDKLFKDAKAIDILTVREQLLENGTLKEIGGTDYLIGLTQKVSSSANIQEYARYIKGKYIKRRLIKMSNEVIEDAYNDEVVARNLLDEAEGKLFSISQGNTRTSESAHDLVLQALKKIEELRNRKEEFSGVPSGFTQIDELTAGWQSTDLIIVAARPAMGKTAFTLSMARNIAVDSKIPVAFFSLEMSSIQLITRLISSETGISSDKLRTGKLADEEFERLHHKAQSLSEAPLYIDDTPSLSIFDLRAKARKMVSQHKVKIIFIDYLQLMTANTSGKGVGNREQEISTISRNLKALAKELDLPIIALSQLSRNVESRLGHKRPQLSDLRESGAIEQDADIVTFLYRPEYYKLDTWDDAEATSTANQAEFIVAKHRNGGLDNIRLQFVNGVFSNLNPLFSGAIAGQGVQSFSSRKNQDEEPQAALPVPQAGLSLPQAGLPIPQAPPVPKGDVNSAFSGRNDDPSEGEIEF
ncbi:replicative DNA helicase [uncultured Capnocytophaga sp.]|mgnify:CR=1 FL=1|uniref:replicative DNA helicase n=1 Tax=uncultured Capnocytophaga sp. TaxID=159273 RepID=UPI002613468F|nr:replicative DNA helicase [uncultured Capnocytophaga sp.]